MNFFFIPIFKKFLVIKYFRFRSISFFLFKNCQSITKRSHKKTNHCKFFFKSVIYNLWTSLKNLIFCLNFLKFKKELKKRTSVQFNKKNIKNLSKYLYNSVQKEFYCSKRLFFLNKNKKFLSIVNSLKLSEFFNKKTCGEFFKKIISKKIDLVKKENKFISFKLINSRENNSFSILEKNIKSKKKNNNTNRFQKFDKLIDYINSWDRSVELRNKSSLPILLGNQFANL